jgi:hypothetical protein
MIRRFALAALTVAVCTAFVADTAGAFTRAQAICVKAARGRAKTALLNARIAVASTLQSDLSLCLNDPGHCVSDCQAVLAACQDPYTGKAGSATLCRADCKTANLAANNACTDNTNPVPDPVKCIADAQFALFTCGQACQAAVQPGLISCSGDFNDCLQRCSN